MGRRWEEEEVRLLRDNYGVVNTDNIANILKRSFESVKNKAQRLGLRKNVIWSDDEDIYLEYFVYERDENIMEAAEFLGRTKVAVVNRLAVLRKRDENVGYIRRPWTKKEEEILKNNSIVLSNDMLALRLRRTSHAVSLRKSRMGLTNKGLSDAEKEKIKVLCREYTLKEIAEKVAVSLNVVTNYVRNNKLSYKKESNQNHIWRNQIL